MTRQLSKKGLDLIKKHEGIVPFVYLDQVELPTIGCGHLCKEGDSYLKGCSIDEILDMITIEPIEIEVENYSVLSSDAVKEGTTITNKEIDKLLQQDVLESCRAVEKYITTKLNDNQFSALVSFTFNLGSCALQRSTLRKKLNQGKYKEVPAELNKWVYAGGKKLDVLVNRRETEGLLFLQNPMF